MMKWAKLSSRCSLLRWVLRVWYFDTRLAKHFVWSRSCCAESECPLRLFYLKKTEKTYPRNGAEGIYSNYYYARSQASLHVFTDFMLFNLGAVNPVSWMLEKSLATWYIPNSVL